ncbi:MAG: thioesterase [Candidatus Aminicenantes bacterium]
MTEAVHKKRFQIRALEIDFRGRLKVESLLSFLMESAAEHAALFGLSIMELFKKNLTWILSRFHVKIFRYPQYGESLVIKTWPSRRKETFTLREFEAYDSQGIIAQATSSWLVMDLRNKRPVRIEARLPSYPLLHKRAVEDEFDPLPEMKTEESSLIFPVFMTDLDFNRHVNSMVYIRWALEAAPRDILFKLRVSEVEINYRAEAFYGDRIISCVSRPQQAGGEASLPALIHELRREADGRQLALLKTSWME